MQAPPKAGPARDDVVERFLVSLEELRVGTTVVGEEAETVAALKGVVAAAGCKTAVVAGIPPRYSRAVREALAGVKTDFVEDLRGRPREEVVGVLSLAEAGVTWVRNGLAAEGALLEVVYDDSERLASSLPKLHVALLESSSILHDLAEALPLVGRAVRDAPPDRKPVVTFISGPSKTGDIEMRLLYGVHGPHSLHAVVLDWR